MAAEAFEGTITDLYLPRRPRLACRADNLLYFRDGRAALTAYQDRAATDPEQVSKDL
jgi:hypothetical protein